MTFETRRSFLRYGLAATAVGNSRILGAGQSGHDGVQPETDLRAGLARVEITPPPSMQMYGFPNRDCGVATGTHDPLFAKVLVLEAGAGRVAIVTLDLGSMVSERLLREVPEKLKGQAVLLSSSHTHSGPVFLPQGGDAANNPAGQAYLEGLERKIVAALDEALQSMFPARLCVARGSLQLGYNRLLLRENGRARALFENPERVPYGPVDPEFVLLRVDDTAGNARALLMHYAVHPVVLGPTNCRYSADYPGIVQARIETAMKGTQAMFVQGGAGDINPLFMARSGKEPEDFKVVADMGDLLAAEILRANRTATPLSPMRDGIRFKSEMLTFADRWDAKKTMQVGITTVLINREVAIAAVPGEPMHKVQRIWKEQAEVPCPLFYGYTYSAGGTWPGYIPDIRSAAYGGYGADAGTRIEIGAGEKIMLRHLTNLYDLLGMWHDKQGAR